MEEARELNLKQREIWNRIASFWDQRMLEGNSFQRELVGPSSQTLLDLKPGERLLEVGCGNGAMARTLATALHCRINILATDFSEAFIELARARTPADFFPSITYKVVDATDQAALDGLLDSGHGFDAILCNMALMDMATIDPLLSAVPKLLRGASSGRFVFCVMHPCFNGADCELGARLVTQGTEEKVMHSVTVSKYLVSPPELGLGMPGQPELHYYFHRPLSLLLSSCFRAGLVMDGILEPSFPPRSSDEKVSFGWTSMAEIPPVLTVRMRPSRLGPEGPGGA